MTLSVLFLRRARRCIVTRTSAGSGHALGNDNTVVTASCSNSDGMFDVSLQRDALPPAAALLFPDIALQNSSPVAQHARRTGRTGERACRPTGNQSPDHSFFVF